MGLFLFVHQHLDGLDIGGDAVTKWQFVRQWRYDNDFSHAKWDHHMTRMGVNGVTWLVQALFSTNWRSYYIGPVFMAALQLPLVYVLGRRFGGRTAGVVAALVITFLPAVHTSLSQLLPDGYVGTYALLATYLIVRLAEAPPGRQWGLLIGICLVAFVGYLAKETFVFFYPGLGAALLLARRKLLDGLVFCGVLLLGLGAETLCYRWFTDYDSRLAVVRSVHFAGVDEDEPVELAARTFLGPFQALDSGWKYALVAALAGALWLLLRNRHRAKVGYIVVLAGLSHVVLYTLSTALEMQRPLQRYMDPATPFVALCVAAAVVGVGLGLVELLRLTPLPQSAPWARVSSALRRPAASLVITGLVVSAAALHTHRSWQDDPPFDGYAHGELMARLANQTYERNLPLAHSGYRGKVLAAFYGVYLHDKRLARDGVLPDFAEARRRHARYTYLVKDPKAYDRKTFPALLEAGCVMELRRGPKKQGMKGCADAFRHAALPSRCDALLSRLSAAK